MKQPLDPSPLEQKIHNLVQNSKWEPDVEEWEFDEHEQCVAYSLFDGTTLVVYEDGSYIHHTENGMETGEIAQA